MACHLDGGSCPHDYPMGKGGSYPVFGSSSYNGGSSYATLGQYNGQMAGAYNGAQSALQYNSLSNPIGLAAYAASPKYNGAYKSVGAYVPQKGTQKDIGVKSTQPFGNYRRTDRNISETENVSLLAQHPRDVARPTATIDDTIDEKNAVAVQRDFLEQMIKNARSQTMEQRQPQYMLVYQ